MTVDAVVVGGGIAGLVSAHRLNQEGARVVLVEKSSRLGGLVETTLEGGYLIEGGPDSFVTAKGSVLALADELGLSGQVIPSSPDSTGSFVWWEGSLHPLPGGFLLMVPSRLVPLLTSSLLSWRGKARVLADLVIPRGGGGEDESLESFVRRRLGGEVLDRIAEPLIAGIHAAQPSTMSLRASFPRFLDMEARRRSLILAARSAARRTADSSHFSTFEMGMGQLTAALAARLDAVDVRTDTTVVGIDRTGDRYTVRLDAGGVINARAVVLAVPAPIASRLLSDVSPRASDAIGGIGQVSNTAVTLAYDADALPSLSGSGFVVPASQRRRIRGVSYMSRKWPGRVPGPDRALLRVFLRADAGRGRREAVAVATDELREMLGINRSPIRAWVRIMPSGLHRYTLGHLDRVATAEAAMEKTPGLTLAGAGFHGVGLNECIESGRRAATSVLEALGSR